MQTSPLDALLKSVPIIAIPKITAPLTRFQSELMKPTRRSASALTANHSFRSQTDVQKGLSQNVKTYSGSPRFLRKTNNKKNHRQNLTVEWTTKLRSVKNRPLLLFILLNFTKLSNHFFKQRPS